MSLGDSSVFELTVPSRMEALDSVRRFVERVSRAFELNEELAHWIELAVNESAINAIQHGNCSDPTKEVFLRITSDGKTLEVVVEDEGEGFDLASVPDPTDVENLLKPGGRGILIIRTFMDEVEVTSLEHGGSRLRMLKKLDDGRAP